MKFIHNGHKNIILFIEPICRKIKIVTKGDGEDVFYALGSCSSQPRYSNYDDYYEQCCLHPGSYELHCKSNRGDGWEYGTYILIGGKKYCNNFNEGHQDQSANNILFPPGILMSTLSLIAH